jgi:hypothetical protein
MDRKSRFAQNVLSHVPLQCNILNMRSTRCALIPSGLAHICGQLASGQAHNSEILAHFVPGACSPRGTLQGTLPLCAGLHFAARSRAQKRFCFKIWPCRVNLVLGDEVSRPGMSLKSASKLVKYYFVVDTFTRHLVKTTGMKHLAGSPFIVFQDASWEGRQTVRTAVVPRWIVCAGAEFCEFRPIASLRPYATVDEYAATVWHFW